MWGREMRAGLAFVILALLIGQGFREWRRSHKESFQRIDPNRASESELTRLPGIGPALAERIVTDRERRGVFASPEALLRVRGIGPKTLDRIRGYLSFPAPAGGDSLTGF